MAESRDVVVTQTEQPPATSRTPAYAPLVDVYETDDAVTAVVDLPGVDAGAADLTIERDSLTVKARMAWSPPEGLQPLHEEFLPGRFERSFVLGNLVDREGVDAEMKNGVLRVTLPKASEALPKKIEVRALGAHA